ncbi:MAG TPA: hypothetical protein VM121_08815 [Acidimicrobiales bacterium]|nr:hypothetical protein [Acidimicrobiales bacterium]
MEQLALLDTSAGAGAPEAQPEPWRLDERTRALGRQGLEQARRALSGPSTQQAA